MKEDNVIKFPGKLKKTNLSFWDAKTMLKTC